MQYVFIYIKKWESNSKFRYLKKLTCKGTLQQVFICLRLSPLLWTHTPPPYSLPVVTPGDGLLQKGEELSSLPLPHQEGPHLLPLRAAALHMEVLYKRNSPSRCFSFAKND